MSILTELIRFIASICAITVIISFTCVVEILLLNIFICFYRSIKNGKNND